ncbi:MAG: GNAT family N-acetyltransferase [Dehalococcoidia bacterium]|nr:MAG: GNAT family N-acetyltransferase [Dehalococcoidia bacterium]
MNYYIIYYMTKPKAKIKIRSMTLEDFDVIFAIDQQIRAMGKAITYASITTEDIFAIDKDMRRLAQPTSYVNFVTRDMAARVELGLVAEVRGRVRGFILGRTVPVGETAPEVGVISVLGVHPDYWRKGIATKLVTALCDKFRAKGIETVRMRIERRDKDLTGFFEHMGFKAEHLIDYTKSL